MHPVNAELRAGDYRDIHTIRCGGNSEKRARWLSSRYAQDREENKTLVDNFNHCLLLRTPHGLIVELLQPRRDRMYVFRRDCHDLYRASKHATVRSCHK